MWLLAIGAICISFSPVFVAVADVSATASAFYRMFFGSIGLIVLLAVRGELSRLTWKIMITGAICGLFFITDIMFWHMSILRVGPGLGTMLANFQVIVLAVVSIVFLGERPDWKFWIAAPLALFGLYLIVGPEWAVAEPEFRFGVAAGLTAALVYAMYLLCLKRGTAILGAVDSMSLITAVSMASALFAGVVLVAEGGTFAIPDLPSAAAMVAYGVVAQVLGWVFITRGMSRVRTSTVGLILLLQPSLSYVWDVLFMGKSLSLMEGGGVIIALTGIYLGSARSRSKR